MCQWELAILAAGLYDEAARLVLLLLLLPASA